MTTVLLLGAGGSAGANVVDALRLSGRGYRVVGVDVSPVRLHLSLADERVVGCRPTDPAYADGLRRLVETRAVDMVHPQPDPEVIAVGALRERLGAMTFLPSQAALETAADKAGFAARMARAGVPVPQSTAYSDLSTVVAQTEAMLHDHERVWVRARTGAGSRASLPVRSGEQARAWIGWWTSEKEMRADEFMAAEMLPGREFAYQSVWQDGELVAGQARERVEYLYGFLTPHGQTSTPAVARTVKEPRVDALAQAAVRALDPRPQGAYCVDIKEDASGDPRVTEVNAGRFFTTSNFLAHAGLNMPDMLVRCALGERLPRLPSSPLPADLYWIRMVDMGYVLVEGDRLDAWPRADR
jgi:carbamoyl-phosphate synthase large subunit